MNKEYYKHHITDMIKNAEVYKKDKNYGHEYAYGYLIGRLMVRFDITDKELNQ